MTELEKHVRYTRDVASLTGAWGFIMDHVEEFTAPNIEIQAYRTIDTIRDYDGNDMSASEETAYAVTIHGHVNA